MGKYIGSYELLSELTTQNAGFSRWGFCQKDGHEYFIKEFLAPVYPEEQGPLSESQFNRKRSLCAEYQKEKKSLYNILSQCRTGNNMIAVDFFRDKSRYYVVTDKVSATKVSISQIVGYSDEKKETLLRSILYSVSVLHQHGIVHSDIKSDNIITVETKDGYCTAKIIDFDAGFLLPNKPKDVQGDLVYFAPETYLCIDGKDMELTEKIDIFALGILFHQYWCGELPQFNPEYKYVFEAVLNKDEVLLSEAIPDKVRIMIKEMLSYDPADRPSAGDLLKRFSREEPIRSPENKEETKSFCIPDELG